MFGTRMLRLLAAVAAAVLVVFSYPGGSLAQTAQPSD